MEGVEYGGRHASNETVTRRVMVWSGTRGFGERGNRVMGHYWIGRLGDFVDGMFG